MPTSVYSIIIVDDEHDIRHGLERYFPWQSVGFEVTGTFANGRDALEFVRHNPTDVAFCDILMRGMNGIEFAESVQREQIPLTIVFLSAHRDFEFAQHALRLGVRRYVVKPTRYEELVRTFSELKSELDERTAEKTVVRATSDEVVDAVRRYCDKNLSTACLEGAARHVGMNPHYLSRLFKEHTEANFSTYLTEARMDRAAAMLRSTGLPTYVIGNELGYSNANTFSRRFRQWFGVSPREYRRTSAGSVEHEWE